MDVATLSDIVKEVSKRTGFPIKVVKANIEVMLRILEEDMRSPDKILVSLPFIGQIIASKVSLNHYIRQYGTSLSPESLEAVEKKMEILTKAIEDDYFPWTVRKLMKYNPLPRRRKYRGKFKFNDFKSNEDYQNELADKLNGRKQH